MKRYAAEVLASLLLMIAVGLFSAPRLNAQAAFGTLLGNIQDQQGAVIPNVTVTARNLETGVTRTATTDSSGAYRILNVAPGNYELTAVASGFRKEIRNPVVVTISGESRVDFSLAVGAASEQVEVTAQAPQINTTNAALGGLVEEKEVRELPLNGRDWLQLSTLQAGVVGGIGQTDASQYQNSRAARGNGMSLSISGNRPTGNVFLVDGLVVNDYANASPGSGLNVNLGVEAVREFRVLTDEYTAEYGRSTGGVVTAAFKSGTNQFHGNAYEFLRNNALDATNFFDKTQPPFHRSQFGASAGGPIRKDKTFIFGDFEELRESKGIAHNSVTLSPQARIGNVCVDAACSSRTAVAINPKMAPYIPFFPVSNGPVFGDFAQYIFDGTLLGTESYFVTKVDHHFSDRTTLSASYQFDNTSQQQPDPYNQKFTGSPSRHQNGVLTLQNVFTNTFLNTAMVGISRTHATDSLDTSAINPIAKDTTLSFIPGLAVPAGNLNIDSGTAATQGGLGSSGADVLNYTSGQFGDDASWIKGRNTFKFGFKFEDIRYNKNSLVGAPIGEWDFDTVANFLQGIPGQFTDDLPGKNDVRGLRTKYVGAYFEDSLALRSNLHMDLGVRYERVSPITEQNNIVAMLPTLASPTPTLGGAFFQTNSLNFSPRIGLAWDPTGSGKTSVRAGFGIYDILPFPYLMENRTNGAPFFESGSTSGTLPAGVFPLGGVALLTPDTFRASYATPNPQRAYSMQWNLSVQRQLAANAALTVGYVGSRANHLPRSVEDADQVPPNLVSFVNGHYVFPIPAAKKKPAKINPNFGRIAATFWDDYSDYNSLVVDFSKQFSRGFFFKAAYTYAKSIDEGSNTFSDNESANTSGSPYAFFPWIQKGVSDFDITHRLVFDYSWNIPTPSSFNGLEKGVLAGWQLGGIFTTQTGPPFSVTLSSDQAFTGDSRVRSSSGGQRPDYNPAPGCSPNAINPGNPFNYINLNCFAFPAPGTLGNLGRNTLRGPGIQEFDASLFKNWPLFHERSSLQFRAEAFNVLNRANFMAPKTKIFNSKGLPIPTSGVLPSPTATSEREIQLALKFTW